MWGLRNLKTLEKFVICMKWNTRLKNSIKSFSIRKNKQTNKIQVKDYVLVAQEKKSAL